MKNRILGLFEFARCLNVSGLGRLQPLVGLLLVGLRQRAALYALADLCQHALVKLHVLRGIGDDPGLQQILQIVLDHRERDDLRALEHPEGSAVDPRSLTVQLGAPPAEIEQFLGDDNAYLGRVQLIVFKIEHAPRHIVQQPDPGRGLEVDGRKVKSPRLPELELDRLAVLDRLADLGIGMQSRVDRLLQRQSLARSRRKPYN